MATNHTGCTGTGFVDYTNVTGSYVEFTVSGDTENVGTPTAYYVGTYGRLRTVTKVPGADQLWLSTTNSDNHGGEPDGSDEIFRVNIG